MRGIATIGWVLSLLYASAAPALAAAADAGVVEGRIIDDTNGFRAEQGRRALTSDGRLTSAARLFARFLADSGEISHEADGRTPAQRAQEAGYDYCKIAENIGRLEHGQDLDEAEVAGLLIDGLKASPHHRDNMLDAEVAQIGVGVAPSPQLVGTYLAVQDFGLPASARISFKVVNRSARTLTYAVGGRPQQIAPYQVLVHTVCPMETLDLGAGLLRPQAGGVYRIGAPSSRSSHETPATSNAGRYVRIDLPMMFY
jgi:uncharacterized protein YkwD